jgi:V8-like Glu-specific endopeptidase
MSLRSFGVGAACALLALSASDSLRAQDGTSESVRPEPLPPIGREVRTPHARTTPKVGHGLRVRLAHRRPVYLPRWKLATFPYYFVGYVSFLEGSDAYQGSGTVVRPRAVLTCAHVLWSPDTGWSSNIKFYRARYGGSSAKLAMPNRVFIHGSYQSNALVHGVGSSYTFSWDIGWMRFRAPLAGGGYSGYATNYAALTGTNYCVAVGYGGGPYPKYCEPSRGYIEWRNSAYFTNPSYDHQGGMSGGPIFASINGSLYETAVVVSSGGGVRAIDSYVFSQIKKLP